MAFIDEKYFKVEGPNIVFTGPYMEAYIPSFYFKKGIALEVGDAISVIGLFNIITYNDIEGKQPNPIRLFNIPAGGEGSILTYPSDIEVKELDLFNTGEKDVFTILKYYKNDIFWPTEIIKSSAYFKCFLEILTGGKIPKSTPYNAIHSIWMKNMELSGLKYDVSDTIYEVVISEIYRNPEKPEQRFGMVVGKDPKHSMYDYRTASPRDITKFNSTFSGFTFENMDEMIMSGINAANTNKEENESPMGQIFKY